MIIIVNYGMGNLQSIYKSLQRIKVNAVISSSPEEIMKADKIILPGVGHFGMAVKNLKKLKIWNTLHELVLERKIPVLGICLGMQLMATHSEEGDVEGFGWFDARIKRFNVDDTVKYKIPHMGWNNISVQKDSMLFRGLDSSSEFYFVHSYYVNCNNKHDVIGQTNYGVTFVSAYKRENIYGVQFHPEKSHDSGLHILKNFVKL